MPARDRIDGEIIDSRDLLEVLEELEAEAEEGTLDEEDTELLEALRALDNEAPSEDWIYGATMVREDYFETYAQELAEDIGAIDPNASWPLSCIDWEEAARLLAQDYNEVTFQGHEYYVR